jgi:hypothetical protein
MEKEADAQRKTQEKTETTKIQIAKRYQYLF